MDIPGRRLTVFLSYASEDRQAARLLRDALPVYGLDVWYDESELGGGEAWDQKIRRQIRECDYFMPLVSATTQARAEGYFRREWRLAVERALDMADDHLFLLPIVIDDTPQAAARVPEKFLSVQWLKVPRGVPTGALEALCRRITSNGGKAPETGAAQGPAPSQPPHDIQFPVSLPGQRLKFWIDVLAWATRGTHSRFRRLPRWIRIIVTVWFAIALLSRCDGSKKDDATSTKDEVTPAKIAKLKDDAPPPATDHAPLLAIAFGAPASDAGDVKLAESTFAMTYGMVAISHRGQVGLAKEPLDSNALKAAVARGRANHSRYVLFGSVSARADDEALTVHIADVTTGTAVWSRSYPIDDADPTKIAADVNASIPAL